MKYKTKKFFKNVEARVLPWSIAVLMITVVLSSVFVIMPVDIVGASWYPASYTYTETFESGGDYGESVDDTDANESWYIWEYTMNGSSCTANITSQDGSQRLKLTDGNGGGKVGRIFNFTTDGSTNNLNNNISWISWDAMSTTSNALSEYDPIHGNHDDTKIATVVFENDGNIKYYIASYVTICAYSINVWYNFNVSFNYTDHTVLIEIDDGVTGNSSWINMRTSQDYCCGIYVGTDHTDTPTSYFDNLTVGSNTELYTVSGGGSEEQCYYNYTGLDGSNRVTFGSGEASDTLYSNATGNWGSGAMLTVEISTNASVNVTDICINLADTDLHTTVHWENISIDVALDNATFPNDFRSFGIDEGDSNISLNASWDADWGTNPFPISNSSNGIDDYIYIRFMVELPSDATTGTHTTDAWKVIWKTVDI